MIFIFLTVLLTVYGQLVIKWQVSAAGIMPNVISDKLIFLSKLFLNPWILSGFIAGFLAALAWMTAMTKFQLSYAYPFMSLTYVLVFIFSALFFYEPVSWHKLVGLVLITMGICISALDLRQ